MAWPNRHIDPSTRFPMGFPPGGVGHSRVLDHLEGEIEAVNFSCKGHGIYCVC
jgi:hypothetical protein